MRGASDEGSDDKDILTKILPTVRAKKTLTSALARTMSRSRVSDRISVTPTPISSRPSYPQDGDINELDEWVMPGDPDARPMATIPASSGPSRPQDGPHGRPRGPRGHQM